MTMMSARWLVILGVGACGPGKAPPPVKGPVKTAPEEPKPVPQAEAEPAPPALRLPGGVRPLRYDVELTLDPASEDFAGTIVTELELAAPARVLWLNAEEIAVESAELEAGGAKIAAKAISQHQDFLGLVVDRPLAAGRAKLTIKYRGKAHRNDGDGIYTAHEGGAWYAFTQFQATDARQAFPCFDEPSYKVPWRLAIRTRKELVAVANAPVESEQHGAGGMKTVRFAETRPLPSYLVAFAVGPFELVDAGRTRGGAPLRIVVPRGHGKEVGYPVQTMRPLVDLLEDYFGIPYPYEKLDLLAVLRPDLSAMENPGLITYGHAAILAKPGEETVSWQRAFAGVTAHEIAHQWFGNYVTLAWWDDTWLNEAFANWLGTKIIERWKPAWDVAAGRVGSRVRVMRQDSLEAARAIRQPIVTANDIVNAFDGITYAKGEAVLTMIERWVGPEAFQRGIRAYMKQHAWGSATYADFVGAMSATTGKDLGPMFDSLVLQSGAPLVSFELRCGKDAPPKLVLGQQRYRPAGSQIDPRRTWQLPVCVRWGVGKATGRDCTVLQAQATELALSAKACPDWVLPNEDGIGYYRMRPEGDLLDRLLARAPKTLTLAERVGLLGDVDALVASSDVQSGVALGLVEALSKDRSRQLVEMSIELIAGLERMVPPELHPSYERLIRRLFRAHAVELGWQGRKVDTDDDKRLRPALLSLVAGQGRDAELGKQATALAWKWLDDHKAVDPEVVQAVLSTAARRGDQKLLDRLLDGAKQARDSGERGLLLGALGGFIEPALVNQVMAILLSEQLDLRETGMLLWGRGQNHIRREIAYRFAVDHFDAISSKLPPKYRRLLAVVIGPLCDEERKAEAEAFFRPRIEKLDGGPRILAQALEELSLCSAAKKVQTPGLVAYLKKP